MTKIRLLNVVVLSFVAGGSRGRVINVADFQQQNKQENVSDKCAHSRVRTAATHIALRSRDSFPDLKSSLIKTMYGRTY